MPKFKNREEYEKFKAEKAKEAEGKGKLIEETNNIENALVFPVVCPECLSGIDNPVLKCKCGFIFNNSFFKYLNSNITVNDLSNAIHKNNSSINENSVLLLIQYLINKFPGTLEAHTWLAYLNKPKFKAYSEAIKKEFYKKSLEQGDDKTKYIRDLFANVKQEGTKTFLGWIIIFIGIVALLISLIMDTTVPSGGYIFGIERVHNIGLLNRKQNCIIVSSLIILIGVLLTIYFAFIKRNLANSKICPYCAETIKRESRMCHHCEKDLSAL